MIAAFLMAICLVTVAPVLSPAAVYAATQPAEVKQGLVKEKGKYYYYQKGVKVKNCWKTIKTKDGKKVKYYFGKKGAAYAAEKDPYYKKMIAVKKIDGYQYGFLSNGQCVTSGTYCDMSCQIYNFTKSGKLHVKNTEKLRKLGKEGSNPTKLLEYLGKAKKTRKSDSCYDDAGTDYTYYYDTFSVVVFKYQKSSKRVVVGFLPG